MDIYDDNNTDLKNLGEETYLVALTLSVPIPDKKKKSTEIFIFTSLWCLKKFLPHHKKCKNKNSSYFFISIQTFEMHRTGRFNINKP